MEKEFIKFYTGWLDSIETIPDEAQRGELALAIIRYAFKGEKYAGNSPFVCVLMPVIYKTIDTANFYAAAGYKGGIKAANKGATEGGRTHITDKQINKKQRNNKHITTSTDVDDNNNNDVVVKPRNQIPPLLADVQAYCQERNNGIDAQYFIDYYSARGWLIGKQKMKDWQAAIRTWEQKERVHKQPEQHPEPQEDYKSLFAGLHDIDLNSIKD